MLCNNNKISFNTSFLHLSIRIADEVHYVDNADEIIIQQNRTDHSRRLVLLVGKTGHQQRLNKRSVPVSFNEHVHQQIEPQRKDNFKWREYKFGNSVAPAHPERNMSPRKNEFVTSLKI